MISSQGILNTIGKPDNKARLIVRMHNTGDIIKQMQAAHYDNSQFAKKIAEKFRGNTTRQTCKNIFNWIKSNITYRIEPAHLQTTKSLQRLVNDGYGDCKHYSGFFAAILTALGIKHHYRFVSYKTGDKTPTHVYVVAYDEHGRQIVCDAVLPDFNTEKPFSHKIDKYMMMHLSGIDSIGAKGQAKAKIKAVAKKIVQAPKKAVQATAKATTQAAKKVATAAKKIPAGAKKISIAPARAAFLTLVALNVRGYASKLKQANQAKLKTKWNNLGGDFVQLQKAINNGSTKKALLAGYDDNIGSAAVVAAATTAVPIIIAVQEFLKDNPQLIEKAKNAFKGATGQKVDETPFESAPDPGVVPGDAEKTKDGGASSGKTILLLAAAGTGLYLLSKGKGR